MEQDASLRRKTNEQILLAYQNADAEAFDEFYRRTHQIVFSFLLYRLGNRQSAEEALQETYFKIHRAILSYDPQYSALSWVMTIAKNVAIDTLRKRSFRDVVSDAEPTQASQAEAALAARQSLERVMANLSSEERDLLISRFWNEESYEEIASRTGTTTVSLRKRVSRLMAKLTTASAKD